MVYVPPVLVAARSKLIGSASFAALVTDGTVGSDEIFSSGWVFFGLTSKGMPTNYGEGMSAVTLSVANRQWMSTGRTTAKFPVIRFTIWADGGADDADTGQGEFMALTVAETIISEFHDPANTHAKQWAPDCYVASCLWAGDTTRARVQGVDGLWRCESTFELEVL